MGMDCVQINVWCLHVHQNDRRKDLLGMALTIGFDLRILIGLVLSHVPVSWRNHAGTVFS